jgi:hypothetical protein
MGATLLKILADKHNKEEEFLDEDSCKVYADPEGLTLLRTIIPSENGYLLTGTDSVGAPRPKVMRHMSGRPAHVADLVLAATAHDAQQRANVLGTTVECKAKDQSGNVVSMKLHPKRGGATLLTSGDLAVSDVHQPGTLSTYAAGYRVCQEGIADAMSPVIMVPKQSDYYGTWNVGSDFSRKIANVSAAGGQIAEVNPGLTFSQYTAVAYALAGALPTEVQANADAPFRPFPKLMQVIVDALRLERNIRVANQLTTSSNFQSVVQTILAGAQWDEGAASNPILVLQKMMDAAYMPLTALGMTGQLWRALIRNPNVQKFFTYKDGRDAIPEMKGVSADFKLPMIYVDETKYTVGGALSFVWGNDVVGIHQPSEMPPTSQMDVATATTFRWVGGDVPPDGALTGGFLVRSYFDQKRGPRGSTVVVCAHNDVELVTSGYAAGLVVNAYQ